MQVPLSSQVAIEARLLHAPEGGWDTRVKAPLGVRIQGSLGPADGDLRLPMVPHGEIPETLAIGTAVHMTLSDGHQKIAFYTTLVEVSPDRRLFFLFPVAVQIQDGRGDHRESLGLEGGVRIELEDKNRKLDLPIVDVSRQGLSFRYRPRRLMLTRGAELSVQLSAPDMLTLRADIQVCNVRQDPEERGAKLAGAQLVNPTKDLLDWLRLAGEQLKPHSS